MFPPEFCAEMKLYFACRAAIVGRDAEGKGEGLAPPASQSRGPRCLADFRS